MVNTEAVCIYTFSPAMSWYQVACPAVASEEVDSRNHQTTPQEGTNAADEHWVLKQGQELRQMPSLAV